MKRPELLTGRHVFGVALIAVALALTLVSIGLYFAPLLNWPSILSGLGSMLAITGALINFSEIRRHAPAKDVAAGRMVEQTGNPQTGNPMTNYFVSYAFSNGGREGSPTNHGFGHCVLTCDPIATADDIDNARRRLDAKAVEDYGPGTTAVLLNIQRLPI